jgi:hypothetical protein
VIEGSSGELSSSSASRPLFEGEEEAEDLADDDEGEEADEV